MDIVLADDHAIVREGLVPFLERLQDGVRVLEAATLAETEQRIGEAGALGLVIIDLYMPGMTGNDGIRRVCELAQPVPVVVLSGSTRPSDATGAIGCGAAGFLPKTMRGRTLMAALQLILGGETYVPPHLMEEATRPAAKAEPEGQLALLTERERQIMQAVAEGLSNKNIARRLDLQEVTIKAHLRNIFRKLGVINRVEAARLFYTAAGEAG